MASLPDAAAMPEAAAGDDDDMMKILVATDNHIGFMEKDPVRYNDSMEAFEEVLQIAKSQNVDFILLGGDLYHENKPSRQTLHCTMELLRKYCMGSRPCPIELRSDPEVNFGHSKFPVINYEDPNYNVAIPVFSIHGNHDDPVGEGGLSAMDVLHVSNLINYFGKVTDVEKIEVSPLLLQKGETKLALYGLGSIRDERLHRMFRRGNVKFKRPSEEESVWFNVLVLHQNRAKHGTTNYIPPAFIPDFFDLVIWGHEHECLLQPQFVPNGGVGEDGEDKGLFISQPGSSVATSLCEGEEKPKHCGILYVKNDCSFKMEAVKLRSVRPFIMGSVCLEDSKISPHEEKEVEKFLEEKVKELIRKAKERGTNNKDPLVRLKVDYYGGYNTFSMARFGQKFVGEVANPKNIIQWSIRRQKKEKKKSTTEGGASEETEEERPLTSADISYYLEKELSKETIELLSNKNMEEAIHEFVVKNETDSVSACVRFSLEVSQKHLHVRKLQGGDIDNYLSQQKGEIFKVQEKEGMEIVRQELAKMRAERPDSVDQYNSDSDSSTAAPPTTTQTSARGRGRGRGSRGKRGGASSSSRSAAASEGTTKRGRGRGRGRAARSSAAADISRDSGISISTKSSRSSHKRVLESDDDDEIFSAPKRKAVRPASSEPIDLTQPSDDDDDVCYMDVSCSKPTQTSRRKKL